MRRPGGVASPFRSPFSTPIGVNTIQEGSFLTLHYRLAGPDGADVINTFADKPATLSLGAGQLAPAMERRLLGLTEGARTTFALAAGESSAKGTIFESTSDCGLMIPIVANRPPS